MKAKELLLDCDEGTGFVLVGLHTSQEMYKLAYLINQQLNIGLERSAKDVDFHYAANSVAYFPWYEYFSEELQSHIFLIMNKSFSIESSKASVGLLFETNENTYKTRFLLPELKNIPFLLKIEETDHQLINLKDLLSKLKSIKQIQKVHPIEPNKIKKPENLIFY